MVCVRQGCPREADTRFCSVLCHRLYAMRSSMLGQLERAEIGGRLHKWDCPPGCQDCPSNGGNPERAGALVEDLGWLDQMEELLDKERQ